MFHLLSKLLAFCFNPLFWFFVLGFYFLLKRKRKALFICFLGLYGLSNSFLANEMLKAWEAKPPILQETPKWGIVLGGMGGINQNTGKMQFSQASDRLWQALHLLEQNKIEKLLISGGAGSIHDPSDFESQNILAFLHELHFNTTNISIESRSKNTYQNATYSYQILGPENKDILLITSAFHMPRALACFKKAGFNPIPYPCDFHGLDYTSWTHFFVPSLSAIQTWQRLIHEWAGFTMYKAKGYL